MKQPLRPNCTSSGNASFLPAPLQPSLTDVAVLILSSFIFTCGGVGGFSGSYGHGQGQGVTVRVAGSRSGSRVQGQGQARALSDASTLLTYRKILRSNFVKLRPTASQDT